jgi:hypothetical protein
MLQKIADPRRSFTENSYSASRTSGDLTGSVTKLSLTMRHVISVAARGTVQQILQDGACHLPLSVFNNSKPPSVSAPNEGTMNELIDRLVANVGIDKPTAEKAVGIILNFLKKEGPPERVQALIDGMPGADALMASQQEAGGGMFDMGGVMGVGTKLMSAGLSMTQVQSVTKEIIGYTREKAGDEAIGEIVAAIPGLSQFV